jgi:light-regulated signal transduction histidine kinase (bacteriophytochrome)
MKAVLNYIGRLSDHSKAMGCLLLCLLVGAADYSTGDFSLSLFYFVPIALASWFIRNRAGIYIAIVCSVELYIINLVAAPEKALFVSLRSWNALMEVCFLFLATYLTSKVRIEMDKSKQRSIALEAANQELESFGYSVSHDLRSPLVWIGGYCHSILKHQGDRLDNRYRKYLTESCKGLQRMEQLIEALLGLSKMSQSKLIRESVDLSDIAQSVAEILILSEPGRQVTFQISDGVVCCGEPNLLRIVLENLLGNAWKYASEQEHMIIEFGQMSDGVNATYFVRDNGAGFDMSTAENLFVPFHRLHDSDRFKGHGIGLATVKRAIDRHKGEIWAESTEGNGATFYFTLWNDRV